MNAEIVLPTTLMVSRAMSILTEMVHRVHVRDLLPLKDRHRRGGYFCWMPAGSGTPLVVMKVGLVPEDKCQPYFDFCIEKATRLRAHPDHNTSGQSRNEEAGQYDGAARRGRGDDIFSFSGYEQSWDLALMLTLGVRMNRIDSDRARAIASEDARSVMKILDRNT